MNVPNRITMARLFVALIFFLCLGYYRMLGNQGWNPLGIDDALVLNLALALFVVAVLSDALDGYFARKLGQVTVLGRIADPFVDKVVVCGAFIWLAAMHDLMGDLVWPSMVAVIVGREFLVTSIRALVEGQGVDFSASTSGKAKMVVQSICISWVLFYRANLWPESLPAGAPLHGVGWAHIGAVTLVWLTVGVTILSGIDYVLRARKVIASQL